MVSYGSPSLFTGPLFSPLRSSSARMKIKTAGDLLTVLVDYQKEKENNVCVQAMLRMKYIRAKTLKLWSLSRLRRLGICYSTVLV